MWHEARKQEKKIRGMLVDFRKRADRRKEFYEKIRADPTQFLQLHARKCKINFEADVTDESHMMPWQGNSENLIDRFDVRAHLDYIQPQKPSKEDVETELTTEERQLNYERYRVLAQNEFLGIQETDFLQQLHLEEQFGTNAHKMDNEKGKKKNSSANAAIGFNYDVNEQTVPFSQTIFSIEASTSTNRIEEFSKDFSDDSDLDMDVSIDVNKIGNHQAHDLNNCGSKYGMMLNDYFSFLTKDEDEKQSLKAIKEQEADKIVGTGRKSRRERRSQREKRILSKPLSPPSYAAVEDKPKSFDDDDGEKSSSSKSPSPENSGKIQYITSFGGEDELQPHSKISITLNKPTPKIPGTSYKAETSSYAEKVKQNLEKLKKINDIEKDYKPEFKRKDSKSPRRQNNNTYRSRSNSRRRQYYSRSRSNSRTRHGRRRHRSKSHSRTFSSSSYSSSRSERSSSRKRNYSSSSSTSSSSDHSPEKRATSNPKSTVSTGDGSQIKRYYGRRKEEESSSSLSCEDDDKRTASNESSANDVSKLKSDLDISAVTKVGSINNPRERLKKKMQIMLNKQYKADKRAEVERMEKQNQEAKVRDEQMRELSLKLRKRQRELRHRYGYKESKSSDSDESLSQRKVTKKSRSRSSSSSSSSTSSKSDHSRSGARNSNRRDRKSAHSISKSPVKYAKSPVRNNRSPVRRFRRSRSRSTGRNYRRYSQSRSRDYRYRDHR